jgi:fumarate hydratase class II
MTHEPFRIEHDSLGAVRVPASALYGAQTQRAIENFEVGGFPLPPAFIGAVALIKKAAAGANHELGLLDDVRAAAIAVACDGIRRGEHDNAFPVDVFQTGSGTSTNMNVNEVVARLASYDAGIDVHPNDHVNMGQSSNDVIPTAIAVSACVALRERLYPALDRLQRTIDGRARELGDVVKTGRTHLMDAMPVRLDQELGAWSAQVRACHDRIGNAFSRLTALALGGTAVGSGVNTHEAFATHAIAGIAAETGIAFREGDNHFRDLASQDNSVELAGALNTLAVALMKIANDLRWMNSGPLSGLGEITLPALQPGSSIMPGKVNPVAGEAAAMACAQVMGCHLTVTVAGGSGNFQLNVMLPVIADNLLRAITLMAGAARILADKAIAGMTVRREVLDAQLGRNPVLVTALTPLIGYERGAEIARRAWDEARPIIDVAEEMTDIGREELERLLDPARLTRGGLAA